MPLPRRPRRRAVPQLASPARRVLPARRCRPGQASTPRSVQIFSDHLPERAVIWRRWRLIRRVLKIDSGSEGEVAMGLVEASGRLWQQAYLGAVRPLALFGPAKALIEAAFPESGTDPGRRRRPFLAQVSQKRICSPKTTHDRGLAGAPRGTIPGPKTSLPDQ